MAAHAWYRSLLFAAAAGSLAVLPSAAYAGWNIRPDQNKQSPSQSSAPAHSSSTSSSSPAPRPFSVMGTINQRFGSAPSMSRPPSYSGSTGTHMPWLPQHTGPVYAPTGLSSPGVNSPTVGGASNLYSERPHFHIGSAGGYGQDHINLPPAPATPPQISVRPNNIWIPRPHYHPHSRPGNTTVIINHDWPYPYYSYGYPYDYPYGYPYGPQVVYIPQQPQVIYEPQPQVVYQPEPQVVYVPQPEPQAVPAPPPAPDTSSAEPPSDQGTYLPYDRQQNGAIPAEARKTIVDIQEAWILSDPSLIQRHVDPARPVRVYKEGQFDYSAPSDEYLDLTRKALGSVVTQSFVLDQRTLLKDGRVRASGRHVFYDPDNHRQTLYVCYWLQPVGDKWIITAIDAAARADQLQFDPAAPAASTGGPSGGPSGAAAEGGADGPAGANNDGAPAP